MKKKDVGFVKNFIADTYSAMGRKYSVILRDNIPLDAMTFKQFKQIFLSKEIRRFDERMYEDETGEKPIKSDIQSEFAEIFRSAKKYFER